MLPLTTIGLMRIMPRSAPVVAAWVGELNQAMLACAIDSDSRIAFFLANVAHECGELLKMEESFAYRAERLHAVFPTRIHSVEEAAALIARGQPAVANFLYANRNGNGDEMSGDGWRFRARGPLGLTFRSNYLKRSLAIYSDERLVEQPELVAQPKEGSRAAASFWSESGCNEAADEGDFVAACALINVGHRTSNRNAVNGIDDREKYLALAQAGA